MAQNALYEAPATLERHLNPGTPGEVDECAQALRDKGVELLHPPTDQPWGHRTLFFRDRDGNVLEIYADI
jgi:catechol 2,3-dioxygenase-like lactoylglutathione lyase family enzyme